MMIRSIFISTLLAFAITHTTLTASAYVEYHIPNPNIYHFNHLLQRQDSSLVDGDIPAPATPAEPSSLPTTLITVVAATSPTDTTNLSSGQLSPSIPSDGSDSSTITTPTNELILPLVPTTSSSIQLSTQHDTSPQSSTPSSSPSPKPKAVTAITTTTTSQLNQPSPSTTTITTLLGGATALSPAQSASFQLGSGPSIVTSVTSAAGAKTTVFDMQPGSDLVNSGAAKRIVRDGRFWAMLIGILGIVWN